MVCISLLENSLQENNQPKTERDLVCARKELEDILIIQDSMARDKARIKWSKEGDRNSAFFHASIKARPAMYNVKLDMGNGQLTTNPDEIGKAAPTHFKDLFSERVGFSTRFYVYFWDVIKQDIHEAINGFFCGQQLPRAWSSTSLALIPKDDNIRTISDLRSISLCNVCHKIIARILNNGLSNLLPGMISEEQSGFVRGRNIQSNIALAHDMVYDLHKKTKDGNNIMIKLDLSKAYDRGP